MSARSKSAIALLAGTGLAALLWPTFFWIAIIPGALVSIVGFLAVQAPMKSRRWPDFALRGLAIGFVTGGIGMWALIRITGWGTSEGWEDLQAVVSGIMGAVVGGFAGAAVGAAYGVFYDRQRSRIRTMPPGDSDRSASDDC